MPISIKISEENYKKLASLSGKLRYKLHRPVSINEAINFLYKKRKISNLAGSWKMSDREAGNISNSLKKGWKEWKTKYV